MIGLVDGLSAAFAASTVGRHECLTAFRGLALARVLVFRRERRARGAADAYALPPVQSVLA